MDDDVASAMEMTEALFARRGLAASYAMAIITHSFAAAANAASKRNEEASASMMRASNAVFVLAQMAGCDAECCADIDHTSRAVLVRLLKRYGGGNE